MSTPPLPVYSLKVLILDRMHDLKLCSCFDFVFKQCNHAAMMATETTLPF